jgi:hypothetical protein
VIGKTMHNVRAETCYDLFTDDDKLKKTCGRPAFRAVHRHRQHSRGISDQG